MNLLSNKYVCFFKALCILNLLVMHYTIIMTCDVEKPMVPVDYVDNFCFVTIEVVLLVSLFTLASLGRLRIGAFLTTVVTCLWAFSNIVYSRFFFQYIPYSAFSESNSLADPVVVRSLIDGFRWGDLYFALSLVLAIVLYRKIPDMRLKLKSLPATKAMFGMAKPSRKAGHTNRHLLRLMVATAFAFCIWPSKKLTTASFQ